jgi:hypothetical protein
MHDALEPISSQGGCGEGYETTAQYGDPGASGSEAARKEFYRGFPTGIMHRVRTKVGYSQIHATAGLPALTDLNQNALNISGNVANEQRLSELEVIYHYLGAEHTDSSPTLSAEAGFFFDWRKPSRCDYLPWKPFMRFSWMNNNVPFQLEQRQDNDPSDKIYLRPGASSKVALVTIDGGIAYRFDYDRRNQTGDTQSLSITLGVTQPNASLWSALGTNVQMRMVSGVSTSSDFGVDTLGGTKACNLKWNSIRVAPIGTQLRSLQQLDIGQILNYYGQDPYGSNIEPDFPEAPSQVPPPPTLVSNPNAIRVLGDLFANRTISIKLTQ